MQEYEDVLAANASAEPGKRVSKDELVLDPEIQRMQLLGLCLSNWFCWPFPACGSECDLAREERSRARCWH